MWAQDDCLYTLKRLPKNGDEAWAIYQEYIQGRECVVHWRMKTHGLIDYENCHPYTVFGEGSPMPMSIMHNGVLYTGNAKDRNKSDTWHYVEDYLKPLLADHPEMFMNPVMQLLIKDHIGSGNRFIMMNHLGETAIINEKDFVTYKGALLSNTYAWDSTKGGFGSKYASNFRGTVGQSFYGSESFYDENGHYIPYGGASLATSSGANHATHKAAETRYASTETRLRKLAQDFFQEIGALGYQEAFQSLAFVEVEDAIEDSGYAIWYDFMTAIKEGAFEDEDHLIAECVRDPDGKMLQILYGVDEPTEEELAAALKYEEEAKAREDRAIQETILAEQAQLQLWNGFDNMNEDMMDAHLRVGLQ
jgi:hypothetical protein